MFYVIENKALLILGVYDYDIWMDNEIPLLQVHIEVLAKNVHNDARKS